MRRPFGLLNINKPGGMTSRQVVDRVTRLVRPSKAGHAGTLDPLATGVLVVCVGPATRLVPFLQEQSKTYRARFLLGRRSNTDDIEGTVVEVPQAPGVTPEAIEAVLPQFIGTIQQRPPDFSAVHVAGRRAYELARRGEQIDLASKAVTVHRIELLDYRFPELQLEIVCGSGTYIRALGRDLGDQLGCGAVMSELVRTAVGPFTIDSALNLDELTPENWNAHLQPPAFALTGRPQLTLTADECRMLRNGRRIQSTPSPSVFDGSQVALLTPEGELAGVAEFDAGAGELAPKLVFLV